MKYGGVTILSGHGVDAGSESYLEAQVLPIDAATQWCKTNGVTESDIILVPILGEPDDMAGIFVTPAWFKSNWQAMRNKVNGITISLNCYGSLHGESNSFIGSAGGRFRLGYTTTMTGAALIPDMNLLFGRLNGSIDSGAKRTVKAALGNGSEYFSSMKTYGNLWTTLGAAPLKVGKTDSNDGGAGFIVFDTYMDDSKSANNAVTLSNGNGSSRRWFSYSSDNFGISFDFDGSAPSLKANASNCLNFTQQGGTSRKMTGDLVNYGTDKSW